MHQGNYTFDISYAGYELYVIPRDSVGPTSHGILIYISLIILLIIYPIFIYL